MSKKKGGGSIMTLKDFHGGSIPSDLPLPSAPSLTVRSSDHLCGNERASSWGRSENRSHPHTSPATATTPFLRPIGKNFDEDERKPLDGVSAPPRRTVFTDDDALWAPPSPSPSPQLQIQGTSSYSARFTSHNSGGSSSSREQGTNVWAMRKEVPGSAAEPINVSKLAHASALDKVSSGIWNSKTLVHYQTDPLNGNVNVNGNSAYNNRMDTTVGEEEYRDAVLARHAQRGLGLDDQMQQGGRNEQMDSKYSDVRPTSGQLGGSELQYPMPSEPTERPRLKLLPRIKPLESSEPSVPDYAQVHGHANFVKPVSDGTESGKEVGHSPKLNLKPRSQPLEQWEGNTERDRNALFGGARPRELVLKERGIDDVAINGFDVVEHSNRIEHSIARAEKFPDHSTQTRYGEKTEDAPLDRRTGKKFERKEQRVDAERGNAQRRNWRGDNQRNMQETDRQQVSGRQPSPETWRKPAEQLKSSPDAVSMHHGKATSAVELAQAFSGSVSDPKVNDRFPAERGLSNSRPQMPFSRLVGPTSRPQINGY